MTPHTLLNGTASALRIAADAASIEKVRARLFGDNNSQIGVGNPADVDAQVLPGLRSTAAADFPPVSGCNLTRARLAKVKS